LEIPRQSQEFNRKFPKSEEYAVRSKRAIRPNNENSEIKGEIANNPSFSNCLGTLERDTRSVALLSIWIFRPKLLTEVFVLRWARNENKMKCSALW
jgi:hypothetical protein